MASRRSKPTQKPASGYASPATTPTTRNGSQGCRPNRTPRQRLSSRTSAAGARTAHTAGRPQTRCTAVRSVPWRPAPPCGRGSFLLPQSRILWKSTSSRLRSGRCRRAWHRRQNRGARVFGGTGGNVPAALDEGQSARGSAADPVERFIRLRRAYTVHAVASRRRRHCRDSLACRGLRLTLGSYLT